MGPPTLHANLVTKTTVDLGAERALKSHLLPRAPAASFLRSHSADGQRHHQHRQQGGVWDFWKVRNATWGKIRTHEPWPPSSDTLHWKLPPGTPLPLGLLICTSQPSWARGSAAALWTLPGTTSARTARSRASLRGCKDASQKAISLCRSATKNSKEGGCRDNQFPEVNINLTHTVFFFLLLGFLKSTFFHKKT